MSKPYDFNEFIGTIGTCSKCHEDSDVLLPCCNEPVDFEGDRYTQDDFCACNAPYIGDCAFCVWERAAA